MSWMQMVRLGVVQAVIGAAVVMLTTTINRVIVVELALPATIPGVLVALHFGVQLWLRPRFGHASDRSGRRVPWIVGGLALCAASGVAVAASIPVMATNAALGVLLASLASIALGAGVSAAGTPLLALMSERARPEQRAGAAAITWILMIAGIIVTAGVSGALLDPFSFRRLILVSAAIGGVGVLLATIAVLRLEPRVTPSEDASRRARRIADASGVRDFRAELQAVWNDRAARTFAAFILLAMLAYSAQDLILEPFAGLAFNMTPGESTKLSGTHHGGVLAGMLLTAVLASRLGQLRHWAAAGCTGSALAYLALVSAPAIGDLTFFRVVVVVLGLANGMFAIGAIGSMMALTGDRAEGRAGVRLGVFGAAQATAYAVGTLGGAAAVDVARSVLGSPTQGYLLVFLAEAVLFAAASALALRSASRERARDVARQRGELLPAMLQS